VKNLEVKKERKEAKKRKERRERRETKKRKENKNILIPKMIKHGLVRKKYYYIKSNDFVKFNLNK